MGSTATTAPGPIRGASTVNTVGAIGRLLRIEARRTLAIWLVPVMAWLAWRMVRDALALDVVLWLESSAAISRSAVVIGPVAAGAAAWVAGRDRRRGIGDLLGTTSRPAFQRDLAIWAGSAAWGLAAYGAVAAVVLVETARRATWGGPAVWPILAGAFGVAAQAAVGTALGRLNLGRFGNLVVAPMTGIGLFYAQILSSDTRLEEIGRGWSRGRLLSLDERWETSVWFGLPAELPALQACWYLGLTAAVLAAVAVVRRRGLPEALALTATVAVALVSATGVVQRTGAWGPPLGADGTVEAAPVALACAGEPVAVCVHPAYRAWLDEIAGATNTALAPLAGVPGAPTRAEQVASYDERAAAPAETVRFRQLDARVYAEAQPEWFYWKQAVMEVVGSVVGPTADGACRRNDPTVACGAGADAQWAVGMALLRPVDSGFLFLPSPSDCGHLIMGGGSFGAEEGPNAGECEAAVDRFAALSVEDQRAWLAANYAALRAGTLTLDDLP
jgi:hypothetical protein